MSDMEIKVMAGRQSRGKYPVSLNQADTVLFAGEVNPHRSAEVEEFIQLACSEFPALGDMVDQLRHELRQLAARATTYGNIHRDPGSEEHSYREQNGCLFYMKQTAGGIVPVQLTNFSARVIAEVIRDDGVDREIAFEVQAWMGDRAEIFTIPAGRFMGMTWPTEFLGAGAIVHAGQSTRDHARAAIQFLSGPPIARRTTYAHTGWRTLESGKWIYVHAGGAIGSEETFHSAAVDLGGAMARYELSDPPHGQDLVEAVRASLRLVDLAPPGISFPIFCALWRSVIGACDFCVHLAGPSGVFKSEIAALMQQHFGAAMDSRHLPVSWHSTDNAIEGLLFAAKDTICVIDDFAPCGGPHDVARWHQRADRIIRAQGNNAARSRMRSDGTLRSPKPPRGLAVSTGEEVPRGHSIRGRSFILEVSKGDIDPKQLTNHQEDARNGRYASAMSGFIRYLAARLDLIRGGMRAEIERMRVEAATAMGAVAHGRTADIVANLALGLHHFISFAQEAGALMPEEARLLWQRGWNALLMAGKSQAGHQVANEPATRFVELLKSAVASGHAHLAGPDGGRPARAEACGWRKVAYGLNEEWQPQGSRVGWLGLKDEIYIDPDASYKAAQAMGGGDGLVITAQTLRKRLYEKSLLIKEPKRDQYTVRRRLQGCQREVIQLAAKSLVLEREDRDLETGEVWVDT